MKSLDLTLGTALNLGRGLRADKVQLRYGDPKKYKNIQNGDPNLEFSWCNNIHIKSQITLLFTLSGEKARGKVTKSRLGD